MKQYYGTDGQPAAAENQQGLASPGIHAHLLLHKSRVASKQRLTAVGECRTHDETHSLAEHCQSNVLRALTLIRRAKLLFQNLVRLDDPNDFNNDLLQFSRPCQWNFLSDMEFKDALR